MKKITTIISAFTIVLTGALAHEGHDHNEADEAKEVTVTGEVLDMACYLDHGATGEKHADCAKTCIESGLPVGIKGKDVTAKLLGTDMEVQMPLSAVANLLRGVWQRYGTEILITETAHIGEMRPFWMNAMAAECEKLLDEGVKIVVE